MADEYPVRVCEVL